MLSDIQDTQVANVDPIQKHKVEKKERGRVRYIEKGAGEERERELGWCCSVRMAEVCQIGGMRFFVCLIFLTAVIHFSPTACSKSFPLQCGFLLFLFFCLF